MSDDLIARLRAHYEVMLGPDYLQAADALEAKNTEINRLRKALCDCATAVGNGAALSPESSIDFIELLPGEIAAYTNRMRANISRLTANPADHRYWEDRYRDEAIRAEQAERALAEALSVVESLLLSLGNNNSDRVKAARRFMKEHTP